TPQSQSTHSYLLKLQWHDSDSSTHSCSVTLQPQVSLMPQQQHKCTGQELLSELLEPQNQQQHSTQTQQVSSNDVTSQVPLQLLHQTQHLVQVSDYSMSRYSKKLVVQHKVLSSQQSIQTRIINSWLYPAPRGWARVGSLTKDYGYTQKPN